MTPEEALKHIESHIEWKKPFWMTVKAALEKQIPEKPIIWKNLPCGPDWADDDWGYRCPCCGNEDIDYDDKFCDCGQKLDWSLEL